MNRTFGRWLENRYLDWQKEQGGRKSITEFASWLGFAKSTVSQWMNGRGRPDQASTRVLAVRLGLEIYDVLEVPRPDPDLFRIEAVWDHLPAAERLRLAERAEEYAVRGDATKTARKRKGATGKEASA